MILSICLPTYNQCERLKQTLVNLSELPSHPDVEILISNNFSDDETRAVIDEHSSKFRIFHQSRNLGFAGNLRFLAKEAKGKYILFLGSGETLESRSTKALVEWLRVSRPSHAVLGHNLSQQGSRWFRFRSKKLSPIYAESISLNVFSRDDLLLAMQGPTATGDFWPHIEWFFYTYGARNPRTFLRWERETVIFSSDASSWAHAPGSHFAAYAHLGVLERNISRVLRDPRLVAKLVEMSSFGLLRALLQSHYQGERLTGMSAESIFQVHRPNGLSRLLTHLTLIALDIRTRLGYFFKKSSRRGD